MTSYICPRQSHADGTSHFMSEVHGISYFTGISRIAAVASDLHSIENCCLPPNKSTASEL